jgi:uncharacterized protein (DUF2141 family)
MKSTALAALISLVTASTCVHAVTAEPTRLILTFETGAQTGAVMVSLFDGEATYAGRAPVRRARVDVGRGERTATFAGLPPGTYAITAFHDLDGDGRMNTNPFGQPIEPYAFSNNARGNMGPAVWDEARFTIAGETAQIIVIR